MPYHRIHIWGDSLAKGVVFDEGRGRYCITPARCMPKLEEALGTPITNHSRMGATAIDGLADFLETPADPGALAVIEFGGNDCDMPWKDVSENPDFPYGGKCSREDFTQTLGQFVEAVRAREMVPLLVTPPPLESTRYFDWVTQGLSRENILSFLGDVHHIYRWQERYANAVRQVSISLQCALFDLRDAFLNFHHFPTLMCKDGIHPNDAGHALIVDAVVEARSSLAAQLA